MSSEVDPKKSILMEINLFEDHANFLPQKGDIKILKKIKAVWVLSGDNSTNQERLDYAKQWLIQYSDILPQETQPTLIYNGIEKQNQALAKVFEKPKYPIPKNQLYIAPGRNIRTIDQVKNFSFPPGLDLKDRYLGIITHGPHLARTLRFMNKYNKIFQDIRILALPFKSGNPSDHIKMVKSELKGILDYIAKKDATIQPYPYTLIEKK